MISWAIMAWLGCVQTVEPPRIVAPDRVSPMGEFSITVETPHEGDLTFWWSVDGEHQAEFDGPVVLQEERTEGSAWTVIVQQEVDGMMGPPGQAVIPIIDADDDTGGPISPTIGRSPDDPASSCDDVVDAGSGVYWFAAAGPIAEPYKARCAVIEGVAWMQVLTVNGDDGDVAWGMDGGQWGQRCGSLETGTLTNGLGEWDNGYEASGYNPGACAVRVNRVRMCPEDEFEKACYITPVFEESVESLHWALNGGEVLFSEGVSEGPNFGDPNDFISRCEDTGLSAPDGTGGASPSMSLEWFVGDGGAARIGYSFNIDFETSRTSIVFGVGVPDSLEMGAGSYVDDVLTEGCSTDASVWIR